jgi:hypothetical protein
MFTCLYVVRSTVWLFILVSLMVFKHKIVSHLILIGNGLEFSI